MFKFKRPLSLLFGISLVFLTRLASADVPTPLEPRYSEAVLAYNSQEYDKAIKILDDLLSQAPEITDFLEMKALVYKSAHADDKAASTYLKILESKKDRPISETAPYHFELGSIYFRTKAFDQAISEFKLAIKGGFNVGMAHFFLGVVAFEQSKWSDAADHLEDFLDNPVDEFKSTAYFYLAQTYLRTGYLGGATMFFAEAGKNALEILSDQHTTDDAKKIAKQVVDAAGKALAPFDRFQPFGEIGLLVGYDSNVLSLPNSVTSPQIISGKPSPEGTLLATVGFMTSPLNTFQLVPSYRGSFNYVTNQPASAGDFLTHTASLYLNHRAFERFVWGLKAEGSWIFNNIGGDTLNMNPFYLSAAFGPYLKYQFKPRWAFGAELFVSYQYFYSDSLTTTQLYQSGPTVHTKVFIQNTGADRFIAPSFYLGNDIVWAWGTQYRLTSPNVGVSNTFHFNELTRLTLGADFTVPIYVTAIPNRTDYAFNASASFTRKLGTRVILLANATLTNNTSNSALTNDAYAYFRWTVSGGASFSIF